MTAILTDAKVAHFEKLFASPSVESMLGLEWQDFEGFVEYVFTCAGYAVKNIAKTFWPNGPGADLELYSDQVDGKLVALVEVRCYAVGHLITSAQAHEFSNKLTIKGVPGYLVTTSDFQPGARAVADAPAMKGRLRLVNGAHLTRFIAYIHGSRVNEGQRTPTTPAPTPPDFLFLADAALRRVSTQTTVLAVGNNRGGVAKTTTAFNLALALAEQGKRVLLVDMDPQASLTSGLPSPDEKPDAPTLLDYFIKSVPLHSIVRRTNFTNVSLLPAHTDMRMADIGGGAHPNQEIAFVASLHAPSVVPPDKEKFDWVILDTPPGQSSYTRSALAASHYLLVPSAFDIWAAIGMNGALETAKAMRGLMGTGVELVGCLLTRYRASYVKTDDMTKFVQDLSFRNVRLLEAKIRHDEGLEVRNREATRGKLSGILNWPKLKGTGATDYQDALKELKQYVHHA